MTYTDRNNIYTSSDYQGAIKMALTDWLDYWATNGTQDIEDEHLKNLTDTYIKMSLSNIDHYAKSLATLVIGEPNIVTADAVTDAEVKTAVTHVLATALEYLI